MVYQVFLGEGNVPFDVWTEQDLNRFGFRHIPEEQQTEGPGYLITNPVMPNYLYWQPYSEDNWVKAALVLRAGELHLHGSLNTTTVTQKFRFGDRRLFSKDTDDKLIADVMKLINSGADTKKILRELGVTEIPGWSVRGFVFNRSYKLGRSHGQIWAESRKIGKIRAVKIAKVKFYVLTVDRETPLPYPADSFLIEGVDPDGNSYLDTAKGEQRDFYQNPESKIVRYSEWSVG